MKVKIGSYVKWIGPYQIADAIFFWVERYEDSPWADRAQKLGDWLAETWVNDFCNWIHKHKTRQEYVKIDNYDHWNADHTLAVIIAPLLKSLKEHKHGFSFIEDEDVPDELRSKYGVKQNEWDWDSLAEKRYEWFLDELIWAFSQHKRDDETDQFYDHSQVDPKADFMDSVGKIKIDQVGLAAHQARKDHAFKMFGKYYQTLWD